MLAIEFSPAARKDLVEIWQYIADEDIDAADRLVERIHDAVQKLAVLRNIGHRRADLPNPTYRAWTVTPYVIVHRTTSRDLVVVRVVHGRRDFRQVFRARRKP
jgi:plasmid stabilization system protein ParE